jgi:predicted alpha/beta hydrolase family esterase
MKFIIFHGSYGSLEGNWFPWLKRELEKLRQEVLLPKFPTDDWDEVNKIGENNIKNYKPKQTLNNWLAAFEKQVLPNIQEDDKLCFIGHSMGPQFILQVVDKYDIQLDSAIFVSPFMEDIKGGWYQFYAVNKTFYKTDFDFNKLRRLIPVSYVLYGSDDPYVDSKYPKEFAEKLGSEIIEIKGGGHLNAEVGMTSFPKVLKLCKMRINKESSK